MSSHAARDPPRGSASTTSRSSLTGQAAASASVVVVAWSPAIATRLTSPHPGVDVEAVEVGGVGGVERRVGRARPGRRRWRRPPAPAAREPRPTVRACRSQSPVRSAGRRRARSRWSARSPSRHRRWPAPRAGPVSARGARPEARPPAPGWRRRLHPPLMRGVLCRASATTSEPETRRTLANCPTIVDMRSAPTERRVSSASTLIAADILGRHLFTGRDVVDHLEDGIRDRRGSNRRARCHSIAIATSAAPPATRARRRDAGRKPRRGASVATVGVATLGSVNATRCTSIPAHAPASSTMNAPTTSPARTRRAERVGRSPTSAVMADARHNVHNASSGGSIRAAPNAAAAFTSPKPIDAGAIRSTRGVGLPGAARRHHTSDGGQAADERIEPADERDPDDRDQDEAVRETPFGGVDDGRRRQRDEGDDDDHDIGASRTTMTMALRPTRAAAVTVPAATNGDDRPSRLCRRRREHERPIMRAVMAPPPPPKRRERH